MVSSFGKILREYRKRNGDTLKMLSYELGISTAYLSAMEVDRKLVPIRIVRKIKEIYNLSKSEYDNLFMAALDSNNMIRFYFTEMSKEAKEVTIDFVRKIEKAKPELIDKLKESLME